MKWISVKDSLPEPSRRNIYLTWGYPSYSNYPDQKEFQVCSYNEEGEFWGGIVEGEITASYWMPIAVAPEEKEDNAENDS